MMFNAEIVEPAQKMIDLGILRPKSFDKEGL